ncbi:hypothetical protein BH11ACT8_BH11ACT8_06550 [soil metagenome]
MDRRKVLLVVAVVVAALGAGLVFVYAQGAENRAADKFATQKVIVALQDITAGESAADAAKNGKLLSRDVPTSEVLPGATNDGSVFADEVALTTIYAGEQLITQKFGSAGDVVGAPTLIYPEGYLAIQVALDDFRRVGSFTRPGTHVAIFVSTPPDTGTSGDPNSIGNGGTGQTAPNAVPRSAVLLDDVLVLAVGVSTTQAAVTDAQGNPLEAIPTANLTIAVTQDEAELVTGAVDNGLQLTFAIRNDASKVKENADIGTDGTKGN